MSFAPGELSTIEGNNGATKSFNFADLPCPPASIASADAYFYNPALDPGQVYRPRIAPPPGIFDLDPAWQDCVTAVNQGFDPPIALPSASGSTESNEGSRPTFPQSPPRDTADEEIVQAAVTAHKVQNIPRETGTP